MPDLIEQRRDDALTVACEYCDSAIGERCVNPKNGVPIEHQAAHHVRLVIAGVAQPAATDERCDCCDLPSYSCGKSREAEQRREQQRHRAQLLERGWISAQFPGSCEHCREPFRSGVLIRPVANSGWRAECCAGVE